MLPVQVVLIVFFFYAAARVAQRIRARELSAGYGIGWVLFWLAAATVVIFPESTSRAAEFFGVGRGADLVVYSALALIFFLLFSLLIKVERLERHFTAVVRSEALERVQVPKEKKDSV